MRTRDLSRQRTLKGLIPGDRYRKLHGGVALGIPVRCVSALDSLLFLIGRYQSVGGRALLLTLSKRRNTEGPRACSCSDLRLARLTPYNNQLVNNTNLGSAGLLPLVFPVVRISAAPSTNSCFGSFKSWQCGTSYKFQHRQF